MTLLQFPHEFAGLLQRAYCAGLCKLTSDIGGGSFNQTLYLGWHHLRLIEPGTNYPQPAFRFPWGITTCSPDRFRLPRGSDRTRGCHGNAARECEGS